MADYSQTTASEDFGMQFDRLAAQIRCALPGVIQSFNPATQTASVQPAIKMKRNLGEGVSHVDLPVVQNVPVVLPFAQGAGLLLTLPIQSGDECLLVFADRPIDNFTQGGGVQPCAGSANNDSSSPRAHSLSDAICIPGIISNPQAVPEYSNKNIELRDRERKQYISLGPEGIIITDGTAKWNMKNGAVTMNAPAGISYASTANMEVAAKNMDLGDNNRISGNLRSDNGTFTDKDGVVLNTHTHSHGSQPDQ